MFIREENVVLKYPFAYAPVGASGNIEFANHRVGLHSLAFIWSSMMALLAYPAPEPEEAVLWSEDMDQRLLEGLVFAITLHDTHRFISISDKLLFHPFFIAMHDANIVNSHQMLTLHRLKNMQSKSSTRWSYRLELIEHLSTIKDALLKNNKAARNYEDATRRKKNTIVNTISTLAQSHSAVYVLRLMLQTPKLTSLEDIMLHRERLFKVMSRRNKICKDRLGYFWSISCACNPDNTHAYHMALTLLFPATSVVNQGRYLQEIKDTWCCDSRVPTVVPCVGYLPNLHRHYITAERPKMGDVISFTNPQHADAINIMIREYYLEQRLVRINHPTKTSGISLKRT